MVGAPGRARTAESPCVPVCFSTLYRTVFFAVPRRTVFFAVLNGSTVLFLREKGEEGRGECVVGALGRARTAESPCVQ